MNKLALSAATEVSANDAYFMLRNSGGKFFRVTFIKENQSIRDLVGRIGVHKSTYGVGMKYNPEDHKNLIVWDAAIMDYRTVKASAIIGFRLNGRTYKVVNQHIDVFSWSPN